jgi:hypothetical protein
VNKVLIWHELIQNKDLHFQTLSQVTLFIILMSGVLGWIVGVESGET